MDMKAADEGGTAAAAAAAADQQRQWGSDKPASLIMACLPPYRRPSSRTALPWLSCASRRHLWSRWGPQASFQHRAAGPIGQSAAQYCFWLVPARNTEPTANRQPSFTGLPSRPQLFNSGIVDEGEKEVMLEPISR